MPARHYTDGMALRIAMHESFSAEDVAAVRQLARQYDESAEVSASYVTKSVDPVTIILVTGTLVFNGFFSRAGEDAYDGLKSFVSRLRASTKDESQVLLEDDDSGLRVILGLSTPADALLELPEDIREAAGEAGELYWDEETGEWKPPF